MSPRTRFVLVLSLAVAAAAPPAAAVTRQPAGSRFEITPFAGYRLTGELEDFAIDFFDDVDVEVEESGLLGVALDFGLGPNAQIEVMASRQQTELQVADVPFFDEGRVADLDLTTIHGGFLYQWPLGNVDPYLVVSGGVTHVDLELPGADAETRLSGSFGGGVKARFNAHLGLRLEARVFVTDLDLDLGDGFDDGFFDDDDEELLVQPQGSAGLILSF